LSYLLCVQLCRHHKTCSKAVPLCPAEDRLTSGGRHRTSRVCGWRQLRWM